MTRALVAAAIAALAASAATATAAPPPGLVAQAARALCTLEARELGREAFAAKYGAGQDGLRACLAARRAEAAALAETAVETCRAEHGADRRAVQRCAAARIRAATAQSPPPALVRRAASALCAAERRELGRPGFTAKYGTGPAALRACLDAHKPAATALAADAVAACKAEGGDRRAQQRCAVERVRAAVR